MSLLVGVSTMPEYISSRRLFEDDSNSLIKVQPNLFTVHKCLTVRGTWDSNNIENLEYGSCPFQGVCHSHTDSKSYMLLPKRRKTKHKYISLLSQRVIICLIAMNYDTDDAHGYTASLYSLFLFPLSASPSQFHSPLCSIVVIPIVLKSNLCNMDNSFFKIFTFSPRIQYTGFLSHIECNFTPFCFSLS